MGAVMHLLCSTAAAGLNPFYENLQTDGGSFFAVRPFYSKTVLKEGATRDYLWPLYSRKSFKNEKTSRALFLWFSHNFSADAELPRHRSWLLPVYFQGQDVHGENYFALFPLGGTLHEFLGRDKILFALFPLFGKSQINDVKTTSVLWPVYSRTRGEGIRRDRVFPLFGKSVLDGKYEKKFVLWPFWTSVDYFYPGNSGRSWILFPLCGRSQMDKESTWWILPPLFRFTDGEREDRLLCPWPFIQKQTNEQLDKLYVWPLWGRKQSADGALDRTFALWPFLWSETAQHKQVTVKRKLALPFFYSQSKRLRKPDGPDEQSPEISRGWKIWPLMSWRREGERSCFRMLELWPLDTAPIERNWAPLWTLVKRTDDAGRVEKEFLWFVWQSEVSPKADESEWALLKGLLGYKRSGDSKRFQFFWFNVGDE